MPAADALPVQREAMVGFRIARLMRLVEIARRRVLDLLPAYLEQPGWKPFRRRLTRLL